MSLKERLYFLDALRAFAILMMLQGHFISGVLDPVFKSPENSFYSFWLYCRGFTAPVFFLVTGWVLMFLLLKNKIQGYRNPRIKKSIRRGLELIIWGYVLRLNLPMLLATLTICVSKIILESLTILSIVIRRGFPRLGGNIVADFSFPSFDVNFQNNKITNTDLQADLDSKIRLLEEAIHKEVK